ncbi:MAG: hypothetical protein M1829_005717 [Trizodia sp. TS-e1964]|nr:MAG: hypothetical protein M1829_005717 [Trizodia sp. TS-e1964]
MAAKRENLPQRPNASNCADRLANLNNQQLSRAIAQTGGDGGICFSAQPKPQTKKAEQEPSTREGERGSSGITIILDLPQTALRTQCQPTTFQLSPPRRFKITNRTSPASSSAFSQLERKQLSHGTSQAPTQNPSTRHLRPALSQVARHKDPRKRRSRRLRNGAPGSWRLRRLQGRNGVRWGGEASASGEDSCAWSAYACAAGAAGGV